MQLRFSLFNFDALTAGVLDSWTHSGIMFQCRHDAPSLIIAVFLSPLQAQRLYHYTHSVNNSYIQHVKSSWRAVTSRCSKFHRCIKSSRLPGPLVCSHPPSLRTNTLSLTHIPPHLPLQALQSLSLTESRLRSRGTVLVNALGSNTCLRKVDLSGNNMDDIGAKMLSKALQINTTLR